jgi:hypothetical protein
MARQELERLDVVRVFTTVTSSVPGSIKGAWYMPEMQEVPCCEPVTSA